MEITPHTQLCGLLGFPVEHSLSPAIHNAAARHYGIPAVYLAFGTRDVKGALLGMRALNIRAFSVTLPHKETVMRFIDWIEPKAKELGNVNTIINDAGVLKGYNTDIDGVVVSLRGTVIKNRTVLLCGAGGAAKTIAYVITAKGGKLHILNRDKAQGRLLAKRYSGVFHPLSDTGALVKQVRPSLIINATPVGMGELRGKTLIPKESLEQNMVVFDLIYNPRETQLLKDAKECGCTTINGKTMFLGQGARQFELWSSKKAPWKVMEQAFEKCLH